MQKISCVFVRLGYDLWENNIRKVPGCIVGPLEKSGRIDGHRHIEKLLISLCNCSYENWIVALIRKGKTKESQPQECAKDKGTSGFTCLLILLNQGREENNVNIAVSGMPHATQSKVPLKSA